MPRKILRRGQDCTGVSLSQVGGNIILQLTDSFNKPMGYMSDAFLLAQSPADARRFASLTAARNYVTQMGYNAFPSNGKIQAYRLSEEGELLAVTNMLGFMHFHNSCNWSPHMWTHIVQANGAVFPPGHRYSLFGVQNRAIIRVTNNMLIKEALARTRKLIREKLDSNSVEPNRCYEPATFRNVIRPASVLPRFPPLANGKQYYIIEKTPAIHSPKCASGTGVCFCDTTYMSLSYTDKTKYFSRDLIHADWFFTLEDVRKAIAELLWANRRYGWHSWRYRVLVMQEDYTQDQDPIIAAGCYNNPKKARWCAPRTYKTLHNCKRQLIREIPDVGSFPVTRISSRSLFRPMELDQLPVG